MTTLTRHEIDVYTDGYTEAAAEHDRRAAAAVARVERDEALKTHLHTLGMPDAVAYRQWCRRHGFSTRLAKSPLARAEELDVMQMTESWRFDTRLTSKDIHRLTRLRRFARRGAWDKPRRAVEEQVAEHATGTVGPCSEARERFCRLVTAFALSDERFRRTGEFIPGVVVESLALIAKNGAACVRDPETWEPQGVEIVSALRSFLRHTFVRYDMPRWLDNIWTEDEDDFEEFGRSWVGLYLHVGRGFGLRTYTLPFPVSKRAAHAAMSAPAKVNPYQALRFGQAVAFGATRARAKRIAMLCPWWWDASTMAPIIEWLACHADFPDRWIGALFQYIQLVRERPRWVCDNRGRWIQRPLNPEWSIRGRTTASLLRAIDAACRFEENGTTKTFAGVKPVACSERIRLQGEKTDWIIVPVETEEQFVEEGTVMRHCVSSYWTKAEADELAIYSLRRVEGDRLLRHVTFCVHPSIGMSEARGLANRDPSTGEFQVLATWANKHRVSMTHLDV